MSGDYEVGYGKPPRQHRFKPGNQAAKGRRRKQKDGISIAEVLRKAVASKRKIKRNGDVMTMSVAEILTERIIQAITTGSAKDLAIIVGMFDRFVPEVLASQAEELGVTYRRAEGSTVALPPADLWEGPSK